ncbi:MAG TPA: SseB family protein [Parasulfuritortus sp.]
MDSPTFEPRNELEHLLLDMISMEADPEASAQRLINMQVFMPVKDEKHQIAGFQRSTQAEPMVLEDDEGHRAVILFSAPERAKDFLSQFPDYSGGLLTEFSWVLRRMGENMSIAINPGIDEGFDFDPHMVAMLVALLGEETE